MGNFFPLNKKDENNEELLKDWKIWRAMTDYVLNGHSTTTTRKTRFNTVRCLVTACAECRSILLQYLSFKHDRESYVSIASSSRYGLNNMAILGHIFEKFRSVLLQYEHKLKNHKTHGQIHSLKNVKLCRLEITLICSIFSNRKGFHDDYDDDDYEDYDDDDAVLSEINKNDIKKNLTMIKKLSPKYIENCEENATTSN